MSQKGNVRRPAPATWLWRPCRDLALERALGRRGGGGGGVTEESGGLTQTGGHWDAAPPRCGLACCRLPTCQCAGGNLWAWETGGMAFSHRDFQNKFFCRTRRRKQEIHNHKIQAQLISSLHVSFKYFSPTDEIQLSNSPL